MAVKTKSVTRPRMSGTAMMARHVAVSRPASQGSVSARSASVRGVPSSRVSLAKIANIDLSWDSSASRALSIPSRTRCSLTGKLTTIDGPAKVRRNYSARGSNGASRCGSVKRVRGRSQGTDPGHRSSVRPSRPTCAAGPPDRGDILTALPGELPFSRGDRVSPWGPCATSPIYRGMCAPSPKRPRSSSGVRGPQAPPTGACVPQAPDSYVVRPRPLPVPVPTCRGLDHQTACYRGRTAGHLSAIAPRPGMPQNGVQTGYVTGAARWPVRDRAAVPAGLLVRDGPLARNLRPERAGPAVRCGQRIQEVESHVQRN